MLAPTVTPPFPIRWGFSTRGEDVPELRIRMKQVHGVQLREVTPNTTSVAEVDGEWTFDLDTPIGIRVADCVPILLAGEIRGRPWIAALHAGWRGTVSGILREAVKLYRSLGGHQHDLWYSFGPCIQPCHFEVGTEVIHMASKDSAWRNDLVTESRMGNPHLDLHGLLGAQAKDLGLDPDKDGSIPRCTFCEPEVFFSFRRGDLEGRQWGFAELVSHCPIKR
jgi:YfiH family protein